MLTTRPSPLAHAGTKARHALKTPVALTSMVLRHSPGSTSQSGRSVGPTIPALLTRMSTGPIRSAAAATARRP